VTDLDNRRRQQVAAATGRWTARRKAEDPEAWRLARQAIQRRYRARNKAADAAHHAVWNALVGGTLVWPSACQRCEAPCVPDASHDDYARPLDVEWLCRRCHADKDRALRASRKDC